MDRFIVVDNQEAYAKGYPGFQSDEEMYHAVEELDHVVYYSILYETDGEKPIRQVGEDGFIEPEDQTFSRDWKWVVKELNKLAAEIDSLKAQLLEK